MSNKIHWLFCAVLIAFSSSSFAGISLDRAIVRFTMDSPRIQDVQVKNEGSAPLDVTVSPFRVMNPGSTKEVRKKIKNPAKEGLLVSPSRFSLAPGESGRIRVMKMNTLDREEERIYRIKVKPDAPDAQGGGEKNEAGIRFIIAYEALVIVDPNPIKSALVLTKKGEILTITNNGNASVLLSAGKGCSSKTGMASRDKCKALPSTRIYPGSQWTMKPPSGATHLYYQKKEGALRKPVFISIEGDSPAIQVIESADI